MFLYRIKIPYPIEWGAPTFDAGHDFGMTTVVLVSLIESTEAYKAASCLASATPPSLQMSLLEVNHRDGGNPNLWVLIRESMEPPGIVLKTSQQISFLC